MLVLVGLLLAIATVNDVVLDTHVNHRLVADLRTWREYTGHDYKNVSTEQDVRNFTTTDVVCGNTDPGPPKERIAAVPAAHRPGRPRPPRGARRLVSAAAARRSATAIATAASGRPSSRARARGERRGRRARAGGARTPRGGCRPGGRWRADRARRGAAPGHARPAELLVRRGVHARARAAQRSRRDAARRRAPREHAAAVVPDRLGRRAPVRRRRARPAPALGARRRAHRPRRVGDRPRSSPAAARR